MYFSTGCVKEKDVTVRDHSRIGIYDVEDLEACAMLSVTTEGAPFWAFDKHYKRHYGRCYLFKSNSDKLWVQGLVTGNRRCGKYLLFMFSESDQKTACFTGEIWGKKVKERKRRVNEILKANDCNRRPQVSYLITLCLTFNWAELSYEGMKEIH